MNKDVVYIEPEEDITDIIGKIEGSKSKIVALVPPKKAGVFKSIVNIKLIMKTATNAKKTAVIVTTDPSIIKLAAATKIPVTKDLQSAPAIPEMDDVEVDDTEVVDVDDEAEEKEDEEKENKAPEKENEKDEKTVDDDEEGDKKDEKEKDGDEEKTSDAKDKKVDEDDKKDEKESEKSAEKSSKKDKKEGKLASSNNPVLRWIGEHKKITAGIGVGLVLLIIFCVWAFGIAPAVTITLKLETTQGNFSENISFVDKLADEKVEEGKFYIEEKKLESKSEVEFEATGKKNVGEKASGTLNVYAVIDKNGGSLAVNTGSGFSYSGLTYVATETVSFAYDGTNADVCDNRNKPVTEFNQTGCIISGQVKVQAADGGANYNISATGTGWATNSGVVVTSGSAMTGGTDKTITIVQQSDIDKAMKDTTTENESVNKQKLLDSLADDEFPIESSFKQNVSEPVSTPAVGEEVAEGKKAKLTVTTTDTIFVIDETKLKEYIASKAKLEKGYKIYEMNDPFVENFTKTDNGYVGKLKTSYTAGSTITENDVVEIVKGKGIGTASRDLTDSFSGVKPTIETSVPWVTSVPGDTNKITIIIKTKE